MEGDRIDQDVTGEGTSRRDFLKKAGAVAGAAAWTVPTMQIINMAAAGAQEDGTSVVTTTAAPPCQEFIKLRLKAEYKDGGYQWTTGVGAQDCLTSGFDDELNPADANLPIFIEGNDQEATVTHDLFPTCRIIMASHKAGSQNQGDACFEGTIGGDGLYAKFAAGDHGISHVELIVECCADDL